LGFVTLVLALVGAVSLGRRVAAWAASALVFAVFALGPLLHVNGRTRFSLDGLDVVYPLPFILLHYVPIVRGNRVPNRFSAVLMLALAVLAAYGAWALARWLAARVSHRAAVPAVTVALAAALLFEHAAVPLPLTDARVPAVYQAIADDGGDFAILQLPLGWRNSFGVIGSEDTRVQYYQTAHGQPMLGGNISRNPPFKMDYFARLPLFRALTGLELYREPDAATDAAARAQAAELMGLYNVRYVVLLPPVPERLPYADTWARVQAYAREVLPLEPVPVAEADGAAVYRVVLPPLSDTVTVEFGDEMAYAHQGEGWSTPEAVFGVPAAWATAREARIFLRLQAGRAQRLTVRAAPFAYVGAPSQTIQASLNGHALGAAQTMADGYGEYAFDAPAPVVRDGLNVLTLRFAHAARPRDVLPADTAIGTTGTSAPVDIEIHAAPGFAFISLFDEAGEQTDGSAGRRGYNIAVLDARSGRLLDKRGFDTWANEFEAAALADYLAAIPDGRIVVAATYDAGGRFLTDAARQAMGRLGADVSQLPGETGAHAFIGIQGAPPGSALEAHGADDATLRLGRNPDRRTLAAAVDWVRTEAQ
ncbi:MAG: hypothetical protein IT317_05915, partial [Anaerolineales bacterium]|nr:hypothetical protein [Anaerolineales bacterium]